MLNHLEIDLAMKVYRRIGDAAIVLSLQSLQHIEDRKLLAGKQRLNNKWKYVKNLYRPTVICSKWKASFFF